MTFIPAVCVSCLDVTLVPLASAGRGELSCRRCRADARIAPSCTFAEGDQEQFSELSCIVGEAKVCHSEARVYAEVAQHALWSGNYARQLERLCGRMPGLLPMQIAAGQNPAAQRGILVKLRSILQTLATVPRGSAEYSLVVADAPRRQAVKR